MTLGDAEYELSGKRGRGKSLSGPLEDGLVEKLN